MSLDVMTPKGQQSVSDELAAVGLFLWKFNRYQYIHTPKDQPADVDGILMVDGVMRQVVEAKCRYDCDLDKFRNQYGNEWLVTWDKIERAKNLAKQLRIGLMGFLYIVKSKTLLVKQITDSDGRLLTPMRLETTQTQATTNGGKAVRTNAYIDMTGAKEIISEER